MADALTQDDLQKKLQFLGLLDPNSTPDVNASYDPTLSTSAVTTQTPTQRPNPLTTAPALTQDQLSQGEQDITDPNEIQQRFPDAQPPGNIPDDTINGASIGQRSEAQSPTDGNQPSTDDIMKQGNSAPSPIGETETLQQQVNQQNAQQTVNNINPLTQPGYDVNALRAAQQDAANRQLGVNLAEAGNTVASAAIGKTPDDVYFNQLSKQAEQPVTNLLEQRKALTDNLTMANNMVELATRSLSLDRAKNLTDPSSQESQAIRSIVSQYEPKLKNDPNFQSLSGSDVKDYLEHFLETESRLDYTKALKQATMGRQNEVQQAREDYQNQLMEDKVSREVQPYIQSSRSSLGIAGRALVSGTRASDMLRNQPTLTSQDYQTIASDINNIISGQTTITGSQKQAYNTLADKASKIWQNITSNPTNVPQPGVKQHLADILDQMNQISVDTVNKNFHFVEASHPGFTKKNPDYFKNVAMQFASDVTGQGPSPVQNQSNLPNQPITGTPSPTTPTTPSAGQDNTPVKVISPEGKTGTIPKSSLQQAISRGFKVVQ